MRKITTKFPTHCPKCSSEDLFLDKPHGKDKATNEKLKHLGVWYCEKCGYTIGRKINQYENELEDNSF